MKRIFVFCFLIFALFGLTFANTALLVNQTTTSSDKQNFYSMQLSYPQFVGKPLSQAKLTINKVIKTFIQQQSQDFVARDIKNNQTAALPTNKHAINLLQIKNTVTTSNSKILSIRFSVMTSFWYAAHPSTKYVSFNFDPATGKTIALSSFFKPGSNYLQSIATLIRPELFKQLYPNIKTTDPKSFESTLLNQGTAPTAANYAVWNIYKNSLMLTFQPYQIAAYVYGAPTILVPLQQLSSFTNQKTRDKTKDSQ